jgi:hypothetical protein
LAAHLTPAERTLRARQAAHIRWANTDRKEASEAQRLRIRARFEAEIPAEVTDPAERAKRAENALRAHMAKLAFESSKARRRKKAAVCLVDRDLEAPR